MAEQTNPQGTRQFSQSMDTVSVEPAATSRVASELLVNVLRGSPMLLSSTQAIDGTHFLKLAQEEDAGSFLSLIESGRIAVHLPPGLPDLQAPLCELLARKAEAHSFELCGWPEIPLSSKDDPNMQRITMAAELRRAVDSGNAEWIENPRMQARWKALRRVDDALLSKDAHVLQGAYVPGPTMRERLAAMAQQVPPKEELRMLLDRLAAVDSDYRSDYYRHIREAGWPKDETRKAREIVDCVYNLVVANSLQVGATLNTHSGTLATMLCRGVDDEPVRVAESHNVVKGMSWRDAIELNQLCGNPNLSVERRAEKLDEYLDGAIRRMAESRDSTLLVTIGRLAGNAAASTLAGKELLPALANLPHASAISHTFAFAARSWPFLSAYLKAKYKWDIGAAELASKAVDHMRRPGIKRRIQLLLEPEPDSKGSARPTPGGTLEPGAPTR